MDLLEKRRQQGKEKGEKEGKEGKVMPFYCKGTLWEKPFRKGKVQKTRGNVMPSCAFLFGLP